ncbi:hypothetical protein BH09ACT12_BH09ACT12_03520 [soil metagenome]
MDRQVESCLSCGHALGIGRFCVNCGHPKDVSLAENGPATATNPTAPPVPPSPSPSPSASPTQASPRPVPPPPGHEPPGPARFPLFADESPSPAAHRGRTSEPAPQPAPAPPDRFPLEQVGHRGRRASRWWWIVAAAAVIVLLGVGGTLLISGSDGDSPGDAAGAPDTPEVSAPTGSPSDSTDPTPSESVSEGDDPTDDSPVDVASLADAPTPNTAPPSRDVDGNAVRYEAFNMLDGQPDTAWRMPGDGSGQEIVFQLQSPMTITEVGLINGYAKVDPGYDGYPANRRITRVEWVFGDGTVVAQDLSDDDLNLQDVEIDDVVSDTVTLRILEVSKPAKGPSGRDYTAISDVALVGTPA